MACHRDEVLRCRSDGAVGDSVGTMGADGADESMTKSAEMDILDCNHSKLCLWFSKLLDILDLLATAVAMKRKIAQTKMDTVPFSFICWTKTIPTITMYKSLQAMQIAIRGVRVTEKWH